MFNFKAELPTEMLPWAQVLMPITSASQTGVGQAPVGPVEGTWVMGFYRDGELAQEPVMVGTLPGIPERFAKQIEIKEQTKFVSLTEQVGVEANIQDDYGSDIINRL